MSHEYPEKTNEFSAHISGDQKHLEAENGKLSATLMIGGLAIHCITETYQVPSVLVSLPISDMDFMPRAYSDSVRLILAVVGALEFVER